MQKMFSIQGLEQELPSCDPKPETEMNEISGGADPEAAFHLSKIHSDIGGDEHADLEREGSQSLFGDKVDPLKTQTTQPSAEDDPSPLWAASVSSTKTPQTWVGIAVGLLVAIAIVLLVVLVIVASANGKSRSTDTATQPRAHSYRLRLHKQFSSVGQPGSDVRLQFINDFTSDISAALAAGERDSSSVPKSSVQIFDISQGSVVVNFRISESAQNSVGDSSYTNVQDKIARLNRTLVERGLSVAGAPQRL